MSLSLLSNLVAKSIRIHHPRFESEEIPPELPHDSWPHHSAPSIPWFSTHWWITHLEGKSDKHDSSESHEVVSRFWSVLAVVYVIFSAFLSIRNIQTWEGQWSIAWSIWLRKIGITSRQNPPDKQSGQNQPYHPHRKYEEGSVTVIFVWTMSVYSPEVECRCSPWKGFQKNSTSYDHVSSAMSCFRAVKQIYAWKLALPLHFPGTNLPRGHKSLDVTNIKTSIVTEAGFKKLLLGG